MISDIVGANSLNAAARTAYLSGGSSNSADPRVARTNVRPYSRFVSVTIASVSRCNHQQTVQYLPATIDTVCDIASKLIVVLGATGNQGGSVVETFLKEPGWKVRGLTRNTSSAAAQKLKEKGAEVVAANLVDTASLVAAFAGANAVFSVTDFWSLYSDPEVQKKAKTGQAMNVTAYEPNFSTGRTSSTPPTRLRDLKGLFFPHRRTLRNGPMASTSMYTTSTARPTRWHMVKRHIRICGRRSAYFRSDSTCPAI